MEDKDNLSELEIQTKVMQVSAGMIVLGNRITSTFLLLVVFVYIMFISMALAALSFLNVSSYIIYLAITVITYMFGMYTAVIHIEAKKSIDELKKV